MISWDVNNGRARRSWARNSRCHIRQLIEPWIPDSRLEVTIPEIVDENILDNMFDDSVD